MPVRVRLALMFALGTAIVVAAAGVLFYLQLEASLRASLDTSLQARSVALATRLAGVDRVSDATMTSAGVETQLIDAAGRVVAASPRSATVPLVTGPDLARARVGGDFATVHVGADRLRVLAGPVTTGGAATS
jgi:hypothetical protein